MDVQRAYNQRIALLGHRPKEPTPTPEESARRTPPRSPEGTALFKASRAMQWRTRLSLTERKLAQVKNDLRYNPQNEYLRAECEKLEKMYKTLLEEAA